jgi:hypothetical protein
MLATESEKIVWKSAALFRLKLVADWDGQRDRGDLILGAI